MLRLCYTKTLRICCAALTLALGASCSSESSSPKAPPTDPEGQSSVTASSATGQTPNTDGGSVASAAASVASAVASVTSDSASAVIPDPPDPSATGGDAGAVASTAPSAAPSLPDWVDGSPQTLDSLVSACQEVSAALCERAARCCLQNACADFAPMMCAASEWVGVAQGIDNGALTFDFEGASEWAVAIDQSECTEPIPKGEVVVPLAQLGERCAGACVGDTVCKFDSEADISVCVPESRYVSEVGGPCKLDGSFADLTPPVCADGLDCSADAPGSATGTCQQEIALGQSCTRDDNCLVGRCIRSVCAEPKDEGETCGHDTECSSYACNAETGMCEPNRADGAGLCQYDQSCASGWCNRAMSVCAPEPQIGDDCITSSNCSDAYCDATSGTCSPLGGLNEPCESGEQCEPSLYCGWNHCIQPECEGSTRLPL